MEIKPPFVRFQITDQFGMKMQGQAESGIGVIDAAYWSANAYRGTFEGASQLHTLYNKTIHTTGRFSAVVGDSEIKDGTLVEIWLEE